MALVEIVRRASPMARARALTLALFLLAPAVPPSEPTPQPAATVDEGAPVPDRSAGWPGDRVKVAFPVAPTEEFPYDGCWAALGDSPRRACKGADDRPVRAADRAAR